MDKRVSLNSRRLSLAEIFIKYAAGVALATVAFVILGWMAGL